MPIFFLSLYRPNDKDGTAEHHRRKVYSNLASYEPNVKFVKIFGYADFFPFLQILTSLTNLVGNFNK